MTNRPVPAVPLLAAAGGLSLAAAMGIGRFAFTPLLPLMVGEGRLDLAFAGWVAAANYAGYLAGALSASRLPLRPAALAVVALLATALFTAAMAFDSPALWLALRFLAGAASAHAFVATSVWCLGALAQRGRADAGGWVYAGVGIGIALTGLYCLFAASAGLDASRLWLHLGALALLLAVPVSGVLARMPRVPAAAAAPSGPVAASVRGGDGETRALIACYGLMGFGYILPATFLPALARSVVADPRLFGLAWPVFGTTAAVSTVLAGRLMRRTSRLRVWAASQLLMGVGVLLPALVLDGVTIALSALLVGGTFMVITLAGVQEMRARAAPGEAASLVGRITAAFALGQIAGPVASALLVQWPALGARGLTVALDVAAAGLLASGAWLAWRTLQARHHPPKEMSHA